MPFGALCATSRWLATIAIMLAIVDMMLRHTRPVESER